VRKVLYYLYFLDEEIEAKKGKSSALKSHVTPKWWNQNLAIRI
jgi:hypothetical protein